MADCQDSLARVGLTFRHLLEHLKSQFDSRYELFLGLEMIHFEPAILCQDFILLRIDL